MQFSRPCRLVGSSRKAICQRPDAGEPAPLKALERRPAVRRQMRDPVGQAHLFEGT